MGAGKSGQSLDLEGKESVAKHWMGRAIAQAVSCRLSTVAARVPHRVRSCGICGEQSGTVAGFCPSISVSPATHYNDCSTFIIVHHPGSSHTRFSPFYHGEVLQSTPLPALASQHTIC
jgi:hypothetical protein